MKSINFFCIVISLILNIISAHSQNNCETIEYQNNDTVIFISKQKDSLIYNPWSWHRGQPITEPHITFISPDYKLIAISKVGNLENGFLNYGFLFDNDQFLFIFTDRWASDSNFVLEKFPADSVLFCFFENHKPIPFDTYYYPEYKDNYLTKYLHSDLMFEKKRKTISFKKNYCIIILYNILEDNVERFINSVESIMIYEFKRVYPDVSDFPYDAD